MSKQMLMLGQQNILEDKNDKLALLGFQNKY